MAGTSTVNELVLRWQELRDQGRAVSAEELCAGRADLLDDLRRQIEALRSMEQFLGAAGESPAEEDSEIGVGSCLGGYRIDGRLGAGGMGTVFRAEDMRLGRPVALKVWRPALAASAGARQRFLREARALAAVKHPHVVTIYQVGEEDGTPFLAMELLEGESLETRLSRAGRLPTAEALRPAGALAEGLAAAHQRGVIHRDVKPANVWLEPDPAASGIKILDFGLARRRGADEAQITASGTVLGTPACMAPEQAGGQTIDHRADLFSLGVILYRATTGRLPFDGPNTMAVLLALATANPPPARTLNQNLSRPLSDLSGRLMCKDLAGRPQSAAEVAAAVRQIVKELRASKSAPTVAVPVAAPVAQEQADWAALTSPVAVPEDTVLVEPEPVPRPRTKAVRGRTALLVALVPPGWWLATVILRAEPANGTPVVEVNDPELVVEVRDPETEARIKNGKLILTGPDGKDRYTLAPGERDKSIEAGSYTIRVEGADGLTVDKPEFTLKKGDRVTVRVTVAKSLDPDREAAE